MQEKETWLEVPGFEDYLVSSFGQVYNAKEKRILKHNVHSAGYSRVTVTKDGVTKNFFVHHLVASAFFEGYRCGMQLCHSDGDKSNNAASNLRPVKRLTRADKDQRSSHLRGGSIRIVETGETFLNAYSCAIYIGGDAASIYKCLRGERRKHMGFSYEYLEEGE